MTAIVVAVVAGVLMLIAKKEYSYWASKLSVICIRIAGWGHPLGRRMKREWLAELAVIDAGDDDASGLIFAGTLFFRYGLTAPLRLMDPAPMVVFAALNIVTGTPHLIPLWVLIYTLLEITLNPPMGRWVRRFDRQTPLTRRLAVALVLGICLISLALVVATLINAPSEIRRLLSWWHSSSVPLAVTLVLAYVGLHVLSPKYRAWQNTPERRRREFFYSRKM